MAAFKLGDRAGLLGPKTVHKDKPRLRWWDGVPSGNGKSASKSKKTYGRFVPGANEPNISDTTGACDTQKAKKNSAIGTRTRVSWVKAKYDNSRVFSYRQKHTYTIAEQLSIGKNAALSCLRLVKRAAD